MQDFTIVPNDDGTRPCIFINGSKFQGAREIRAEDGLIYVDGNIRGIAEGSYLVTIQTGKITLN